MVNLIGLAVLAVSAVYSFGWPGIGIVAAVYLLMPYKVER